MVKWRMLGPVQYWDGRRWQPVLARKERQLLAILLLRAGQVVERGWLVDTLWGDPVPQSAARLLNHYVWRLRRLPALSQDAVRTVPSGYQLDISADDIDSSHFSDLLRQARVDARGGDHALAADRLTAALALWQGDALADGRGLSFLDQQAGQLEAQRIEAMELLAEALASAHRHDEAQVVLEQLIAIDPFREHPWRLLMLSLHHRGRRPEALDVYQRLWRMWTQQLGIEPSQLLQQLHQRLLTGDNADPARASEVSPPVGGSRPASRRRTASPIRTPPVTVQLPGVAPGLVGRRAELAQLTELLERSAAATTMLATVTGPGGIGKTTLVLHWAHAMADRFPDGQIYVDLRGFDANGVPMPPPTAVRILLDALDVPPQRIPPDFDAQAALLRRRLAGKRTLMVLDNARDAEQVRPLLPGPAGGAVIVTSRNQLAGLSASHGACATTIGLLSNVEAWELLAARLGRGRVDAEPDAVDEIVARCGHLPLALAIVAARAAGHATATLSAIAADLRQSSPLDALHTTDSGTDLRSVFSWSYAGVSAPAARMFRLLGLHAGQDITLAASASLIGEPMPQTRRWLAELVESHLLVEYPDNRFAFHDLLRQYAFEQAHRHDDEADRDAATRRLLCHYLHTAHGAGSFINLHNDPVALSPAEPGAIVTGDVGEEKQALAWFAAEVGNLQAVLNHSVTAGWHEHTVQLDSVLAHYLYRSGRWIDQAANGRAAVAAAHRLGDSAARVRAHHNLARACLQLGDYEQAQANLLEALAMASQAGDPIARGEVHHVLSWVLERKACHDQAFQHASQALDIFHAYGHTIGQARTLNTLGWFNSQLGNYHEAVTFCESALRLHETLGHREGQAGAWHSMGFALHHLGQHERALTCFGHSLTLYRQLQDRYYEGATLDSLADTLAAIGERSAASSARHQALAILSEMGHPRADEVRTKISATPR